MPTIPNGAMMHLACPTCRWLKAVLAFEQHGVGTAFCPNCQHMWELVVPPKRSRVTIGHATRRHAGAGPRLIQR